MKVAKMSFFKAMNYHAYQDFDKGLFKTDSNYQNNLVLTTKAIENALNSNVGLTLKKKFSADEESDLGLTVGNVRT